MKKIVLIFILSLTIRATALECEPCGERTLVNFQEIKWLSIQKPEDLVLLNEWSKLYDLWHLISQRFAKPFVYIKRAFS